MKREFSDTLRDLRQRVDESGEATAAHPALHRRPRRLGA